MEDFSLRLPIDGTKNVIKAIKQAEKQAYEVKLNDGWGWHITEVELTVVGQFRLPNSVPTLTGHITFETRKNVLPS